MLRLGSLLVLSFLGACEPAAVPLASGALDGGPATPATVPAPPPAKPVDRQSTVEGARDLAIELLEQQAYKELVTSLVAPQELERIAEKSDGIDGLVEQFASSEKPAALLDMLRNTRGKIPALVEDGAQARFDSKETNGRKGLSFERVQGRWYLLNQ